MYYERLNCIIVFTRGEPTPLDLGRTRTILYPSKWPCLPTIFVISAILAEKIEDKVYVNQDDGALSVWYIGTVENYKVTHLLSLKGKLSWAVNLKKTAWTFQVWFKAASMQDKTAHIWRAFGGERDNSRQIRAYSVNEKWPENLAYCHKRIYLNACAT